MPRDERRVGDRLGVLHECRPAEDASLGRMGRGEGGLRRAAVEAAHHERRFPGDVPMLGMRRCGPGSRGFRGAVAPRALAEARGSRPRWSRKVDHDFVGAHVSAAIIAPSMTRCGRSPRQPVLVRERLALGRIDDDNRRAALVGEPAHRAPLAMGREPGSASPAQSAALDDIDQPFARRRAASPSRARGRRSPPVRARCPVRPGAGSVRFVQRRASSGGASTRSRRQPSEWPRGHDPRPVIDGAAAVQRDHQSRSRRIRRTARR